MKYVNSFGVTSGHHMGIFSESWRDVAVFERAHKNNKLTVRTYVASNPSIYFSDRLASYSFRLESTSGENSTHR